MSDFKRLIDSLEGWETILVEQVEQELLDLLAEFQLTLELIEAHYAPI